MLNPAIAATLGPMRAPFLLLVPVVIGLGAASAVAAGTPLDPGMLFLAFFGGLAAHVAVNALNEYEDFRSGLDLITVRTPFSGGTGTLPAHPDKAHYALVVGVTALGLVLATGLWLSLHAGPGLLLPGLIGIVLIVAYTRWITRSPLLCLLAPGIAFGPVMVMGTDYALSGGYSSTATVASLVPLFLVSNLLLINQFPDIDADTQIGRRHLIIRYGVNAGVVIYGIFLIGAYGSVVAGVATGALPVAALLALLTAPLGLRVWLGLRRYHSDVDRLIPYLGQNVLLTLLTPTLLSAALLLSRTSGP